jgi:hypothetical protein
MRVFFVAIGPVETLYSTTGGTYVRGSTSVPFEYGTIPVPGTVVVLRCHFV